MEGVPATNSPPGLRPDFFGFSPSELEADFKIIRGDKWIDRINVLRPDGTPDIPAIAERMSIELRHDDLLPEQALLSAKIGSEGWIVRYDHTLPETHQAFLLGHEIGHIVLFSVAERSSPGLRVFMDRVKTEEKYRRRVEAVCDFFSSKLLGYMN